jgi:spore maturation protein CgeB
MTKINYVYAEVYPDSLELFFKHALQEYAKKRPQNTLVLNGTDGDVILDIKCRFIDRVQKMKGIKVLYFPDNLDRFGDLFDKYEQHYDYIFFAHKNEKIDNKRYFHLPLAYDPYIHYPLKRSKTIDVAFVGTKHKDRAHIAKIPGIKIYGNEWGGEIYPVYSAKKRNIYAQTRIMVNHHVAGDTSPNMRTFECLAMRTFMLSDLVPEELKGGMVHYSGQSDLDAKIVYYLKHGKDREVLAEEGRILVQSYTYENRVEEMMEIVRND